MAERIKGITVVIGGDTTELNKALSGVNSQISNTQKQLKDVERLLKLDPTNTKLLEQRHRLLGEAVTETKTKLDALKTAEKQVQQQFQQGKISQEQYDKLQREIVETEQSLESLEKKARKSSVGLSKLSAAAGNVSKNAKKVQNAFSGVTKVIGGIATAVFATIPATEELRTDISKLDASAEDNAVSVDAARDAWREFAVQSGETDSAVEATANLLQAGFTESNLQKAVEGLAGAAQRFPDTLKIESLADSLQETLATGTATGQFGELLDRLGIGAKNFSESLSKISGEAERQNYVLQTLADAGLNDSYNAWKENNEEMLANKDANLQMQEAMSELAELALPLMTQGIQFVNDLIRWFTDLDKETQTIIVVIGLLLAAVSPLAGVIRGVSVAVGGLNTALAFLAANPVVASILAIISVLAVLAIWGDEIKAKLQEFDDWLQSIFMTDMTEIFGPVLGDLLNGALANFKNIWDSIKHLFDGIIDFVRGVFTGDWQRAWEGVKNIFGGIMSGLVGLFNSQINAVISILNAAISGINTLISGLNRIKINIPSWVPLLGGKSFGFSVGQIGKIPYLANGGVLSQGSAIVGEAGPEILTMSGNRAIVQPLTNTTTNHNLGGISITVYGAPGQDVRELAEIIMQEAQQAADRRGAVFA